MEGIRENNGDGKNSMKAKTIKGGKATLRKGGGGRKRLHALFRGAPLLPFTPGCNDRNRAHSLEAASEVTANNRKNDGFLQIRSSGEKKGNSSA